MKDDTTPLRSWQKALIYLFVWLIPAAGLKYLSDDLLDSLLLHIAYTMILLPGATLAVSLVYTRRCGLNPWLALYMGGSGGIMYFVFGFNALRPNFLLMLLICLFFGLGLGNIFKNEPLVAAQQDIDNRRRRDMEEEEKRYISLIDADPETGRRANLRKRNKRNEKK